MLTRDHHSTRHTAAQMNANVGCRTCPAPRPAGASSSPHPSPRRQALPFGLFALLALSACGGLTRTFERMGVMGALRESFDAAIHGDIVRRGNGTINRRRAELSHLEARVLADLPRFQNAEAGSPEAVIARQLGIRGDAGDADRVRAKVAEGMEGLHELQQWLIGSTWQNGDLESSAIRAAAARGWHMTSADAFIEDSLIGDHSVDEAAHGVLDTVEHAHLAFEATEAMEVVEAAGVAVATPALVALTVGVAGLGLALYLHHLGQEQQAERITAARALGL